MSLNPALADSRFCPRCGAEAEIDFPRSLRCTAEGCHYHAFFNPKPVAGTIPFTADGSIVLLRRAFDPGAGLWTFPGGFVDLGETVESAALRETREEVGLEVELDGLVGVYSREDERVVLVVFRAVTTGQPIVGEETTEVGCFTPDTLPWDELAFWSTEAALRDVLGIAAPA